MDFEKNLSAARPHIYRFLLLFTCAQQNCRQLPGSRAPRNRSGGGVRCGARPAQFKGKESVGTQQRWRRHDKRQRGTHSGHDAGGSAAYRVRRLAVH
jgi:hypothetical protein